VQGEHDPAPSGAGRDQRCSSMLAVLLRKANGRCALIGRAPVLRIGSDPRVWFSAIGPAADAHGDDTHRRLAHGTADAGTRSRGARFDDHAQHDLHQREPLPGLAVEEAVVAHAAQSGRQHVQQHAPEEVGDGQGAVRGLPGFGVAVAERDGADDRVVLDQIALAEDAAVEIT
jgi:hypothetical protein